jgi:ABC-type Zn uptake system ZnuABC Zn-binding protein ZnuA
MNRKRSALPAIRLLALSLLVTGLVACNIGSRSAWQDSFDTNNGKINVVSTVAPISSIVRNIGGDRINLYGVVPDGVDSHTFEPKPSDARVLAKADLVIVNGLHLEVPTEKLAEANLKPGARIQRLGDNTISRSEWVFDFSFPESEGDPNPHLWMNVDHARKYADLTRQWLGEADPRNKDYYDENYQRYRALLDQLDQAIAAAVRTVPEKNRKLLTYHDSWAYFARRYGMTVIGAAQPSDFSEPRPQEVAALIDQIKREQVPAVFGSEVFPSKVLEQIARESGAKYVDNLRDDEPPGKPGDRNHTYVGMMLEDVRIMVEALGGSADALKGIDPGDTYERGT